MPHIASTDRVLWTELATPIRWTVLAPKFRTSISAATWGFRTMVTTAISIPHRRAADDLAGLFRGEKITKILKSACLARAEPGTIRAVTIGPQACWITHCI